jgi:hypothetical protein
MTISPLECRLQAAQPLPAPAAPILLSTSHIVPKLRLGNAPARKLRFLSPRRPPGFPGPTKDFPSFPPRATFWARTKKTPRMLGCLPSTIGDPPNPGGSSIRMLAPLTNFEIQLTPSIVPNRPPRATFWAIKLPTPGATSVRLIPSFILPPSSFHLRDVRPIVNLPPHDFALERSRHVAASFRRLSPAGPCLRPRG